MSQFAVGDIHGCARTLDALLELLDAGPADHIVFVGDYVDRGPRSREVIETLLSMEDAAASGRGPGCTFIRGNHDQMMLDWIERGEFELWRQNGALATLSSYAIEASRDRIPKEHVGFLRRTQMHLVTDEYCFVHAGLNPDITVAQNLEFETPRTFLWSRGHFGSKRRWEKTVVCGHTPNPEVLIEPDLINIDTGCCFPQHPGLGRLSAIRLDDRQVFEVENRE